ncbi:hypothetical protein Rxyl_0718 [Rubrobacter xylanophilus DSM 9941]|uniref:SseB protein N-terminal domain-containing protein n=1 Tax=Rubrobacter xylanophilus (strain DSM 9941 / JCM 11954 / NBRC 16129 / PRD-1) TaxID=266117 RepID=Q1AY40_RUBXD|nr:hypothetical protein [Rubrobacter xylanophilus]ABG03688.1 hypothetical protein Rxyl_0718 [Rubrobacter xylanophilus DSM 9941]
MRVLTLMTGEGEVLPVFSFREEAELFLMLGGAGGEGWRVRETRGGELLSLLSGLCRNVAGVALDPFPELGRTSLLSLVCVGRERFVQRLLRAEGAPSGGALRPVSGGC